MSQADHYTRARALNDWGMALWWTGVLCIGMGFLFLHMRRPTSCLTIITLYWPLAVARNACFRAADMHLEHATGRRAESRAQ
jgi:hypothetical protein